MDEQKGKILKLTDKDRVVVGFLSYNAFKLDDGKKINYNRTRLYTNDLKDVRPVLHRKSKEGIYLELIKMNDSSNRALDSDMISNNWSD